MSEPQESPENNLNSFQLAIESFEYTDSLFCNKHKQVDLFEVIQELRKCRDRIDTIIFEENTTSPYFVDLFQLKQLLLVLIKATERKLKEQVALPPKLLSAVQGSSKEPAPEKERGFIKSIKEVPRVTGLREIAGLWEVKKLLKTLVILPKTQPQLFVNHKSYNSILLFGPPGTGKTRLVHALASEANAELYCVSTSAMLSSFVGQSEKNIRLLFDHIRESEKFSLLFIDEVDGFCRTRHETEQDHNRRLKTELMCQLTKIEDVKHVFLICATNCPWDIDIAFLRRFHKRIYVPLPNSTERHELFQLFTKNTPLQEHSDHWEFLIDRTEGLSGSDISDLVQSALSVPITELEDTKIWKTTEGGFYEPVIKSEDFQMDNIIYSELSDLPKETVKTRGVEMLDLFKALDDVRPTVSAATVKRYEAFISKDEDKN